MKYLKTYESKANKPIIGYYPNGQKKYKSYYNNNNNKLHREDGPAYQWWDKNGRKRIERYFVNDKLHRENGPAVQWWHNNGQKEIEEYYINDKCHREDGPAVQRWYTNGQKKLKKYYLNNKEYIRKDWIEKLKKINSPYYEEQKIKYESELYNL